MPFPVSRRPLVLITILIAVLTTLCGNAQNLTIQIVPGGNATLTWNASLTGAVDVQRSINLVDWGVVSVMNRSGSYSEFMGNGTRAFYRLSPLPMRMLFVKGSGSAGMPDLRVSNTETTWAEWKRVRAWAASRGYDLGSVGSGDGEFEPVRNVNWFDVVKWCNARSEMEGKTPVYRVSGNATYRVGEQSPTPLTNANGYRLPSEAEWAWVAKGGELSQGFIYSGSNTINQVAWYADNSGGRPREVAQKNANELGFFDMSGNVFEWCWDQEFVKRGLRGGFWGATDIICEIGSGSEEFPDTRSSEVGFRIFQNADRLN